MNWTDIWVLLFGTTHWLGLDMGFWVSMGAVTLLVIVMNVVFWCMKPKTTAPDSDQPLRQNEEE